MKDCGQISMISVIIPTYNRAGTIVKAVESVLAQEDVPLMEILIMDDGSSDATERIIRNLQDRRIRYFRLPHRGACAARNAGIKVSCLDSKVNAASRSLFVNQAGVQEIGQALMDAVYDISGGSGDWAILSATSQASNQNAWIDAMKNIMESDSKYANLNLVEVAYGDDEPQKSTDQTQALLSKYPDLKVICAPTTVGIAAAAKVLQDQGSACKLTGLGLPSEMAAYIGDDASYSCPYMFLWNPIDLGRLGAHVSMALVDGKITGAVGETFEASGMESSPYTIVDAGDGGTEVILGAPFKFDGANINDWKDVY